MGSENPGTGREARRHTAGPIRQFPGIIKTSRISLSTTVAGGEARSAKALPRSALTPISRLKKFQKVRDKNLRKQVLDRNNLRKQLKMLESVENSEDVNLKGGPESLKGIKRLNEDFGLNGISEEGEDSGINGIDSQTNGIDTNGDSSHHEVEEEVVVEVNGQSAAEEFKEPDTREDREIEVEVSVIERSPSRRSTPRKQEEYFTEPSSSSSPYIQQDNAWRNNSFRISGRRPIHREMSPLRKRKSDSYINEPESKRQAITPSVPSPGWKFLSPFSMFQRRTPASGLARPIDDSLFVNISSDSALDVDLDSSALDDSTPSFQENQEQQPVTSGTEPKSTSWLCSIM